MWGEHSSMWFLFWMLLIGIWPTADHAAVQPAAVEVAAKPDQIYIARSELGQHLNFDFILTNQTREKLIINKVELSIFDSAGKLVRREFYDEYGRKSLELAVTPTLGRRSTAMFFNPFHTFAADLPLSKLHYEFSFSTENRRNYFRTEIDIAPVPYETKTNLTLPMRGRVLVWDGHDHHAHHRRFDYLHPLFAKLGYKTNYVRYAYDFVVVDEQGLMYKGQPRVNDGWYRARPDRMEDYYSFGAPIYATGTGRVFLVKDAKPDDRSFKDADLEADENAMAGNYIVIDHLNGEFSWFNHIKQRSARVKVGQMVKQGEIVAAVGASGQSLFPHLDYVLRTSGGSKQAESLPSYFSNFRRLIGSRSVKVKKGAINTGDIVDW